MRDTIKKLRETLPPLLTIQQYCRVMNRCQASAYTDLREKPGLGVKVGGSTRIVRDFMLDEMTRLPAWIPQKDRVPKVKATAPKKPRRDREPEVRP